MVRLVCKVCGVELKYEGFSSSKQGDYVSVHPCVDCLEDSYKDGKEYGYDEGYQDAKEEYGEER